MVMNAIFITKLHVICIYSRYVLHKSKISPSSTFFPNNLIFMLTFRIKLRNT